MPDANPFRDINRRLKDIDRRIRELSAAQRLRASTFPAGVIPTSALASPSAAGYVAQTVSGFGIAAAGANLITTSVTVPADMTGCSLMLVGRVYAGNSTAAADYLFARAEVDTVAGNALPVPVGVAGAADDAAVNVATVSTVLTGLSPGASFTVRLWAKSQGAAWATDPGNVADLSGVLSWFVA